MSIVTLIGLFFTTPAYGGYTWDRSTQQVLTFAQYLFGGVDDFSANDWAGGGEYDAFISAGSFFSTGANASQISNIPTPIGETISGTGAASVNARPSLPHVARVEAFSFLEVEFTLDSPQPYQLTGTLQSFSVALSHDPYTALAQVELFGNTGLVWDLTENGDFLISGVLDAGFYRLRALARAVDLDVPNHESGSASASFDFELTFVPEPAAILMIVPACAFLIWARRRTPRRASVPGEAVLALVVALVAFGANHVQAAAFGFQGLGDLPGGTFSSSGVAISADASTVVGSSISASGSTPFRWTESGGMVAVPSLDATFSPTDISGDGSVVVGTKDVTRVFRWTIGGIEEFGFTNTGSAIAPPAVSGDGAVVVWQDSPAAMRWTSGSGAVNLGDLPGGGDPYAGASGVSGDGTVVVGVSNSTASNPGDEAFRSTTGGGMVGIGDLPGGSAPTFHSIAGDVSLDGMTVVGVGRSSMGNEAFRWSVGGGMVGLDDLPGGAFDSRAFGVSGDGAVIVGVASIASGFTTFVWTQTLGILELRDYLSAEGISGHAAWPSISVSDVSADGRTLVGRGINPLGQTEAWVATVPEPSTLVLTGLGIGFGLLCLWRTRRAADFTVAITALALCLGSLCKKCSIRSPSWWTVCRQESFGCLVVIACLSAGHFSGQAKAASIAVDNLGTLEFSIFGEGTLGWEFQTNAALSITSLGFFDRDDDGLNVAHQVGIWDSDQNLIGSTVIPSGTSASLVNGFRYVSVAPINLASGQNYIIAATQPSPSDNEIWITVAHDFSVDPNLSYEAQRFIQGIGLGASLTFPTNQFVPSGDVRNFGPNFQFNVVPEPSSFVLAIGVGLGLLFAGLWRSRTRTMWVVGIRRWSLRHTTTGRPPSICRTFCSVAVFLIVAVVSARLSWDRRQFRRARKLLVRRRRCATGGVGGWRGRGLAGLRNGATLARGRRSGESWRLATVPEPSSIVLTALGLVGLLWRHVTRMSVPILVLFGLLSSIAGAGLVPISQSRSVEGRAAARTQGGLEHIDSAGTSAPDFGPFSSSDGVTVAAGLSTALAFGSQQSSISPTLVQFLGVADVNTHSDRPQSSADGIGGAHFGLVFDLMTAESYQLDISAMTDDRLGAHLRLEGSTTFVAFSASRLPNPGPLHEILHLPAGRYVLQASAQASAGTDFDFVDASRTSLERGKRGHHGSVENPNDHKNHRIVCEG
ncbi:MAG: PEP-CTERM sorting domain-containing protein, partial [Pirellulales bacterium]